MPDFLSTPVALVGVAIVGLVLLVRRLHPKPYPGIPYNEASAKRFLGDMMELGPIVAKTNEFSDAVFTVTTQKLGTPIAQMLFPGIRKPLITLEDPREIEDILVRRAKEFDKSPMVLDIFGPMFARASLAQLTTPALKAQKRLWADVMSNDFLRRTAAPNIHKATSELVDLWRLKATTVSKDQPFNVLDDLKNAALDVIWASVLGEEPGTTRFEIQKLKKQLEGTATADTNTPPPVGTFLKEQVAYIGDAIARNSNTPSPWLFQKLETFTPRYRRFRRTVVGQMQGSMRKAVERYQAMEESKLEDKWATDTCAMDLVLRRQVLQAKKAGEPPSDPTNDASMLDEMFILLVGGHDSTANTLSWLLLHLASHPSAQSRLRSTLLSAFPGPGLPTATQLLTTPIPYLDATVEETIRLAGTAKANIRQALVDTTILGCHIPKGAEVFMNYHVNRAPVGVEEGKRSETSRKRGPGGLEGDAGRDLGVFEPARWLKGDGEGGEVFDAGALPGLAFGGGYRGCFGRKLAMMELRMVLVLLVLNFEFLPLPEELDSLAATEKIFREPTFPYAKIRVL
ncbi:cytochrome P450 3A24 [Staphylotrichum tortipilum]|uniref:Cytochrome P450 3A24 n=1 Tax=Staphylotrichum tortipilum TaxID=2831512 RepID=A0AAN6RNI6_9PEZI|nr:cytochrome P450 3A24 [Staphylotrichum longicolle]